MKCIKKKKEIKRVSDSEAAELVKQGWTYCPKHEWKAHNVSSPTRPTDEAIQKVIEEQRPDNMWFRSENDFRIMSKGGMKDVRARYYPGWESADFQRVIEVLS